MRLLFVVLLLIVAATPARAEECRVDNCSARIAYLFIPHHAQLPARYAAGKSLMEAGRPLFTELGLPKVGAEVVLARPAQIYTEAEIRAHLPAFKVLTVVKGPDGKEEIDGAEPQAGDMLRTGARVQILSYVAFGPTTSNKHHHLLFALVNVIQYKG
jgi:hypothetical protein